MKKLVTVIIILLAAPAVGLAQSLFAPYLFTGVENFRVGFHPGGDLMLMDRATGRGPIALYLSAKATDGTWISPQPLPFSGRYPDIHPAFSPDGDRIYFASRRPKPGTDTVSGDWNLWSAEYREDGTWAEPEYLELNSGAHELYPTVDRRGVLVFASYGEDEGRTDLYMAERVNGRYAKRNRLPAPVNSAAVDHHPDLTPDGSKLHFYSTRKGGYGSADLYVAYRDGSGEWGRVRNLGPSVNTERPETGGFPWGEYLYFFRAEEGEIQVWRTEKRSIGALTEGGNGN